jgi:hypothetical protein
VAYFFPELLVLELEISEQAARKKEMMLNLKKKCNQSVLGSSLCIGEHILDVSGTVFR